MSSSLSIIPVKSLLRPLSWVLSGTEGKEPTEENIRSFCKEKKIGFVGKRTVLEMLGAYGVILSAFLWLFGYKNENKTLETSSYISGLASIIATGIGTYNGIDFEKNVEGITSRPVSLKESLKEKVKVKIARTVIDEIKKTIGSKPPEEGGMLGGDRTSGTVTHFYFDETAKRNCVEYVPDNELINLILSTQWNQQGINFFGFVHSHPSGVRELSGGDLVYAKRILDHIPELEYIFLPLVLNAGTPSMEILPYAVVRNGEDVKSVDVELDILS